MDATGFAPSLFEFVLLEVSRHKDLGAVNKSSAAVTAIHDGGSGPDVGSNLGRQNLGRSLL